MQSGCQLERHRGIAPRGPKLYDEERPAWSPGGAGLPQDTRVLRLPEEPRPALDRLTHRPEMRHRRTLDAVRWELGWFLKR